ncbi:MAG TPA: 3-hydroxyacyl-[acyl-carrier-protein] dehydratase FabZ [Candidatus Paceibacterota bacterium]
MSLNGALHQLDSHGKYPEEYPRAIPPVTSLIPHRGPMLLVDMVVEFSDMNLIATHKVSKEPFWATGHFPAPIGPIMPGVLIVEAMAQAAGCHAKLTCCRNAKKGFLVGIDGTRFYATVVPRDILELAALRVRGRGGYHVYETTVKRGRELVAKAVLQIQTSSE